MWSGLHASTTSELFLVKLTVLNARGMNARLCRGLDALEAKGITGLYHHMALDVHNEACNNCRTVEA